MSDEFEDRESECEAIRKQNAAYLEEFRQSLEAAGLSKKTINNHVENADFYIDEFLLHYEPQTAKDGITDIGWFMGDFFIRKCMWSTPTTIKQNAASLKKFYKFLLGKEVIEAKDYRELLGTINDEMDDWLDMCEEYNNFDDEGWDW